MAGTLLLSELLSRLSDLAIESTDVRHLMEFFVARLGDEPCVVPVLWGLQALLTRYDVDPDDACRAARGIFESAHVQSMQISGRLAVFKILDKLSFNVLD